MIHPTENRIDDYNGGVNPAPAGDIGAQVPTGAARRALGGFFLSGFLAALLGAILPAWGYHLNFEYITVGNYFLSLAAGVLIANELNRRIPQRRGISFVLTLGCALAVVALVFLAFAAPPARDGWRVGGLLFVGLGGGVVNGAIFHAIAPTYYHDPAATVNLGGVFFGLGCLVMTMLVAGTYYAYSVTTILLLAALIPALFGILFWRTPFPAPQPAPPSRPRIEMKDLRRPAALLLVLLLFLQFGNEWTVAGWLAVYLAGRLGVSPESSLWMLVFYWLALLVGRVAATALLSRISHGRMLLSSAAAAMFGCVILMSTDNRFGAYTGLLLTGGGFAVIYPLVAEKIGHRFTEYHPGLFQGVFSLAMAGAMLAPASAAYMAGFWGISVLVLPLIGTIVVVVIISLIWLESKVGG